MKLLNTPEKNVIRQELVTYTKNEDGSITKEIVTRVFYEDSVNDTRTAIILY
jgi:hypothetical protein